MRTPKISVLLCVYNPDRGQLLSAVNSMIDQTFADWEMILYDDGSHKKYDDIIYEVSCLDERIRYIKNFTHHSLAFGLNQCLKLASGDYIARMDGDDISHPNRLKKQFIFLEKHPQYMWVGSNIIQIGEKGEVWGIHVYPKVPQSKDFLKYSPYAHSAVVMRRELILKHGAYVNGEKDFRGEDYELFMRLHAEGEQGYNLQEPLLYYRESVQSYYKYSIRYSIQEAGIRWRGFCNLKILNPYTLLYVVKPIIRYLVPNKLIYIWKRQRGKQDLRKWYRGEGGRS